jgi:hypothetical protein
MKMKDNIEYICPNTKCSDHISTAGREVHCSHSVPHRWHWGCYHKWSINKTCGMNVCKKATLWRRLGI